MCYTIGIDTLLSHKDLTDIFLKKLKDEGFVFGSFEGKDNLFLKVFMDDDESKNKMSDIISEFIYHCYIKNYFSKSLDESYYYFEKCDKDEMFNMLSQNKEKAFIKKELLKYMDENNILILKGFVNFRLADYLDLICDKAQFVAEEYLDKKEYMDFVKLLKYFVSVQTSSCEKVDVIVNKNGEYVIFDEENKQTVVADMEVSVELLDEVLSISDVLISELISLAPKKIIIHKNNNFNKFNSHSNNEVLKMIESVFEGCVMYCAGCDFCAQYDDISIKNNDKTKLDSDIF